MGLKMDILLFVVPFIFLSLYIFRLRYQPYALEALKRGIVTFSDSSSRGLVYCFQMGIGPTFRKFSVQKQ